ncbi:MAG: ribonuclease Z [Chloroflexi bacterium]|nr:MAG: ribonuclease Z [Chloroflexota bacterium]HDN79444.1 ribonuclease Z [Chloroflexota bacterium]
MFELIFLGTSASAPSVSRNLSAAMVLYRNYRFLIDCGEGTQRQLLKSGLGFRRLNKILLTHGHLDHILGLGGLISTFARWETISEVEIYGGRWALQRVQLLMKVVFMDEVPPISIIYRELEPGVIMEDEHFVLKAFPVIHRGPDCLGFSFEEKPRRPFLVDKAEALGVPAGPERRRLVQGESITLPDGRVIHPDDVLGPPVPGAKLVFVGDAAAVHNLVDVCYKADALVIEATYLEPEKDLAKQHGHLTAAQAARLALEAEVRHLYLTHISRRYSAKEVLAEAKAIFPNTTVANDFDRINVKKATAFV